ncbi:RNase H domain protein [Fusarium subglutinans]|uniref:RNase H domain protein n=1 Tax=Gibberella subglutinans TaxID=42677 RepID=A0A8H5V5C0_GIBSU|nr:RNase H domain protein [Fusarium subglutinans]KAF5611582.1 RNase H domain protein [Fusarium subglutinans]
MSTTAKRPKVFAYANFDLDALISLAARLRGQSCTIDTSTRPRAGSTHWVIFVVFEDGVEWVFRSPRCGPSAIITEESASKLLISEASTLKYLRGRGSILVPEVFSFSGDGRNEIGVPYILMSKASGRPLSDYDWIELSRIQGYTSRRPLLPMTHRDREKVMAQLGATMLQLLDIHFDKIGSLFQDSNGNYCVGECLSPSLLWQHRDELEGIDRGPFNQESQYLRSLISAFNAHAEELSLTPHSFFAPIPNPFEYPNWASYCKAVERWQSFCSIGDKVEGNKNRLDFCIAGQFLNEMVPHFASAEARFVLCHPDLHLGNIFIDEDFNITCIIDWSSASTSPVAELLSTPGLNGSLSPPNQSLVTAFRSGFSNRGQVLGPQQWERADKMWYFLRLVRMLSTQDYTLFKSLFELVYNENADNIPRLFHERRMQEAGQAQFAKLCQGESEEEEDEPIQKVDDNGQTHISVEVVVARKVSLMCEMNSNFVADKRLWLWIESVLETLDI